MKDNVRAEIVVGGLVQGVGFRYYAYQEAELRGLKGYVKNLYSGQVHSVVEGEKEFKDVAYKIHKTESEADTVRRKIELMLYQGAFLPIYREDYIVLLELIDKVANMAESASDFILLAKTKLHFIEVKPLSVRLDRLNQSIKLISLGQFFDPRLLCLELLGVSYILKTTATALIEMFTLTHRKKCLPPPSPHLTLLLFQLS